MPLQNRVTPRSQLIAEPARGLVYGNRGCLHDSHGRIRRSFDGRRWLACRLRFRDWNRSPLMQPRRFTELFFLDDATAFAAGHRPCALCRRADYERFCAIWRELHPGDAGADAIDARLHAERLVASTREQRHHSTDDAPPDGAFVLCAGAPWLVLGGELLAWSAAGYGARTPLAAGSSRPVTVITPPSLVAVLRAGWDPVVPLLHPTALSRPRAGAA